MFIPIFIFMMLIGVIGIPIIILYHLNNTHKTEINDTIYIDALNKVSKYGLGKKFTQVNENQYNIANNFDYTGLVVGNSLTKVWISLTDKNLDWNVVLSNYADVNEVAKFILNHLELYTIDELLQKDKDEIKQNKIKEEIGISLSNTGNAIVDNLVNTSILRYHNYQ